MRRSRRPPEPSSAHTDGSDRISSPGRQHHAEREPQRLGDADRIRERPDDREAERHQHERAEHVVGADAGLHLLGDLALEEREPERQVHREAGTRAERRDREQPHGRRERRGRAPGRQAGSPRACTRRAGASGGSRSAIRLPTIAPTPADGDDRAPGAGAAEILLRDHRSEDDPGAEAEVADPEQDHRRPEPRSAT